MQPIKNLKCTVQTILIFLVVACVFIILNQSGTTTDVHFEIAPNQPPMAQSILSASMQHDIIDIDHKCNNLNWMDEMNQDFIPFKSMSSLKTIKLSQVNLITDQHVSEAIALIIDIDIQIKMDNESSFKEYIAKTKWQQLVHGSLLVHRVQSLNDIRFMQRFVELTNAWGGWQYERVLKHIADYIQYNVTDVFCWKCGCVAQKEYLKNDWSNEYIDEYMANNRFYHIAKETKTDKVRAHKYHRLYAKYLPQFMPFKNDGNMLEIGLGCNMGYGPGESAKIWTQILNNVHFIEYDGECVEKYMDIISKSNYTVHVGDQADLLFLEVLKDTFFRSKGLDIIVDDGGHWNKQIIASFISLWHLLNPDGVYFIEDFGGSAYCKSHADDRQPTPKHFGEEHPATAQYFVKSLLFNLFCQVTKRDCMSLRSIEQRMDHVAIKKLTQ